MTRSPVRALLVTGITLCTLLGTLLAGCSNGKPDAGQSPSPGGQPTSAAAPSSSPSTAGTPAPRSPATKPTAPGSTGAQSASPKKAAGTPEATVNHYVDAFLNRDCKAMKQAFLPDLAAKLGDCSAVFGQLGAGRVKKSDISVGDSTITGDTARVPVTIQGRTLKLTMTNVSGHWYLAGASR